MGPAIQPGKLKSVHYSDDVNIRNLHQNLPVKIEESHIRDLSSAEKEELAKAFGHDKVCILSQMINVVFNTNLTTVSSAVRIPNNFL